MQPCIFNSIFNLNTCRSSGSFIQRQCSCHLSKIYSSHLPFTIIIAIYHNICHSPLQLPFAITIAIYHYNCHSPLQLPFTIKIAIYHYNCHLPLHFPFTIKIAITCSSFESRVAPVREQSQPWELLPKASQGNRQASGSEAIPVTLPYIGHLGPRLGDSNRKWTSGQVLTTGQVKIRLFVHIEIGRAEPCDQASTWREGFPFGHHDSVESCD